MAVQLSKISIPSRKSSAYEVSHNREELLLIGCFWQRVRLHDHGNLLTSPRLRRSARMTLLALVKATMKRRSARGIPGFDPVCVNAGCEC